MSHPFIERLRVAPLLADGGMGTLLHAYGVSLEGCLDEANLNQPSLVLRVHSEYLSAGADVIVLAGYMKRIGPRTLAAFAGRILNIHPALLPRHGGPGMYGIRPHEAVLAAGDEESGATVHVVDERYDHGPILRQRRVRVRPDDTPQTLQQRVLREEHGIYAEVLADIVAGRITLPVLAS